MPLKSCDVHFLLDSISANETRLTIMADYQLKFGVLGTLMNWLMVERQFTGNLTLMINGIDEHLKTGEVLPKGWTPAAVH